MQLSISQCYLLKYILSVVKPYPTSIFKYKVILLVLFMLMRLPLFSQQKKIIMLSDELPTISYKMSGDSLVANAEKYLYKTISQINLNLYLLRPQLKIKKLLPAIIYFSGGGWLQESVVAQIPNAAWFRDQGIIGICASYRVKSKDGTTPLECIKDAKSAVRYVRTNAIKLGIDPNKIIVAGGSAGGHIAACTQIEGGDEPDENLSVSSKPNALVLHNPVLGEGFGDWFFKHHPQYSPIAQVKKGWPPTILSCGTDDEITPIVFAEKFTKQMQSAGNICELIKLKDADHSGDWPVSNPNFLPTLTKMTMFLQKWGFILNGKIKH